MPIIDESELGTARATTQYSSRAPDGSTSNVGETSACCRRDEVGEIVAIDLLDEELADDAGFAPQHLGQRELVVELGLAGQVDSLVRGGLTLDELADVVEAQPHTIDQGGDLRLALRLDGPHVVAVPAQRGHGRDHDPDEDARSNEQPGPRARARARRRAGTSSWRDSSSHHVQIGRSRLAVRRGQPGGAGANPSDWATEASGRQITKAGGTVPYRGSPGS